MADAFDRLIGGVLGREGGYVNHPNDPGGETNWGVTVGVARANGYQGKMRDMTRDQAVAIYRRRYWTGPGYDAICAISEPIAEELFDTGINMGPAIASQMLQRVLNGLNRRGADYADLKVDGEAGAATRAALKALIAKRGAEAVTVVLRGLNSLQGARYIEIAEGRPASEDFLFGWLRTRVA